MKRILRRCLRLFHVASLTLVLRIELLAGAGEDREDFAKFQSRVHRLESAIGRQRQKLGIPGLAIVVVNDDRMIRTKGSGAVMSKPATARFRTTFQYNNVQNADQRRRRRGPCCSRNR